MTVISIRLNRWDKRGDSRSSNTWNVFFFACGGLKKLSTGLTVVVSGFRPSRENPFRASPEFLTTTIIFVFFRLDASRYLWLKDSR